MPSERLVIFTHFRLDAVRNTHEALANFDTEMPSSNTELGCRHRCCHPTRAGLSLLSRTALRDVRHGTSTKKKLSMAQQRKGGSAEHSTRKAVEVPDGYGNGGPARPAFDDRAGIVAAA